MATSWLGMLVLTCPSLAALMRSTDSSTDTASDWSSSPTSEPVLTSPVTSEGRVTTVGFTVGSIMYAGAIELPPDALASVPISTSRSPAAPAE